MNRKQMINEILRLTEIAHPESRLNEVELELMILSDEETAAWLKDLTYCDVDMSDENLEAIANKINE